MTSHRMESSHPDGAPPSAPRVLVIAAFFPSPIQPWLLNQVVQVYRRGGSAWIVASAPEGTTYPAVVDELGLLDRTLHLPFDTPADAARGLATLLSTAPAGGAARRGLMRLIRSPARPRRPKTLLKAVSTARVLDLDFDVVHAHSLRFAYDYLHVARICGAPMVLTFHGHTTAGVGLLEESKRRELFDSIDLALVNTEFARSQLESIGCPPDRIEILPQGIRLEDYPFEPRPFPQDGPVRLLTVCRLQQDKGVRYAIEGVHRLLNAGHDVVYTIVGGGPEEAALRARVARLGREDRISLTGRVSDGELRDLYRRAHVFILPSLGSEGEEDHTETQGVVLQEAQASGVIVTASRVGGIPECVDDGVSAFLFPDRDPRAIAETVATVLENPDRWAAWQAEARRNVVARFDIDRLGDTLLALYARSRANR